MRFDAGTIDNNAGVNADVAHVASLSYTIRPVSMEPKAILRYFVRSGYWTAVRAAYSLTTRMTIAGRE